VITPKTVARQAKLGLGAATSLLVLGFWCGTAAGSSGVTIPPGKSTTTQISQPATEAAAVSESLLEEIEKLANSDNSDSGFSTIPSISAHLPGVSESLLPGFRRQMFRTDI